LGETMRACKHFSYTGTETYILESEGWPWNAVINVYKDGKLIYSSHETGLFWDYLLHIIQNPKCLKESGWDRKAVKEKLQEIMKEWNKISNE